MIVLDFGPSQKAVDAILQEVLERTSDSDFVGRLQYLLNLWLGCPYFYAAVGDGIGAEFDQFPLYRTDAFDCVSYVSLVLVLLHAQSIAQVHLYWRKLNYTGAVCYLNRNHFMETEWLPALMQLNWALDITKNFKYKSIDLTVDAAAWIKSKSDKVIRLQAAGPEFERKKLAKLKRIASKFSKQKVHLNYVTVQDCLADNFNALKQGLPDFCLIESVNPCADLREKIGTEFAITHCGFVVKKPTGFILYHASEALGQVVAVDFIEYCLQRAAKVVGFGFCVQELQMLSD